MTPSDRVCHHARREARIGSFGQKADSQDLATPFVGSALSEVRMSATVGRPSKHDQRARTARFLTLCATGMRYDLAARQAGVKPERALRLVSDRDAFEQTIAAFGTAA